MKAYLLRWKQRNRTWEFVDGPLAGESLSFTLTDVVHSLLRSQSALIARSALHKGCHLIVSKNFHPETMPFLKVRSDKTGALYEHDEHGAGWIENLIVDDSDRVYLGVHV